MVDTRLVVYRNEKEKLEKTMVGNIISNNIYLRLVEINISTSYISNIFEDTN